VEILSVTWQKHDRWLYRVLLGILENYRTRAVIRAHASKYSLHFGKIILVFSDFTSSCGEKYPETRDKFLQREKRSHGNLQSINVVGRYKWQKKGCTKRLKIPWKSEDFRFQCDKREFTKTRNTVLPFSRWGLLARKRKVRDRSFCMALIENATIARTFVRAVERY